MPDEADDASSDRPKAFRYDRVTVGVGQRRTGLVVDWRRTASGVFVHDLRFADGSVTTHVLGADATVETDLDEIGALALAPGPNAAG